MRTALPLLALLAAAAANAAEDPAVVRWAQVNQLPAGSEIRITLIQGKTLRGFLLKSTPDSLEMNAATSTESLARQEIKRVQLKRPGHRGRNTLIGLGIGAAGGLAVGAGIDSKDDFLPNLGKIVLGSFGALVGTVVGVAMPTGGWREIYRAP